MSLSPRTVHERLNESVRKLRWSRGGRYVLFGAALSLGCMAAGLLLDAHFHFGTVGRWIGFVLVVGPVLVAAGMSLHIWVKPVSEQAMARRIETACDGAQNVLISAVQFDRTLPADSPLRKALFQEMSDPFPRVSWKQVFDLKLIAKLGAALGVALLVMAACGMISTDRFANSAARLLMPAKQVAALTQTRIIAITPGNITAVHGGEVRATAQLGGVVPRSARIHYREPGSSWQKAVMNREVGEPVFLFTWKGVTQPLEYYIEAGDTRSTAYRVNVRPRTAIRSRFAEMEPPAYMKLGRLTVKDFSALQNVFPGAKLTVTLEFNHPLAALEVSDDQGAALPVTKLEDTRWQFALTATASRSLKVKHTDTDKYTDFETMPVAVRPDDPPKIQIIEPSEGRTVMSGRDGALDVAFQCSDNFGISTVGLYRMTPEARDGQLVSEWKDASGKASFSATAKVALEKHSTPTDERVTFFVVACDQNNTTGPGVTFSRPVVVTLRTVEALSQQREETGAKFLKSLEELIRLQELNLEGTRTAVKATGNELLPPLLSRQGEIASLGVTLATGAELISPATRSVLRRLIENEMKEAVLALRRATGVDGDLRAKSLARAVELESLILAKLQGAPEKAKEEVEKGRLQDTIAGLEELLRSERILERDTRAATESAAAELASRQDKLADKSLRVRDDLKKSIGASTLADKGFLDRLTKVVGMFDEFRIHPEMLAAAEQLDGKQLADAATKEQQIVASLTQMISSLNEARIAHGVEQVEGLREALEEMKEKLNKLENIQREIVEKSKDVAKKDEMGPGDVSTGAEIRLSKDLMASVVEQMLLDAHVLPDFTPINELRSSLVAIKEEVAQKDADAAEKGQLEQKEIAVQKEDGILKALEKAEERVGDIEQWLPEESDTIKWLMENFDKAEMPEIPNVPLPDSFEDLIGDLQKEQEGMMEEANDATSNVQMSQNKASGWSVLDGPMGSYGAQGKSGNQRPNKTEQSGRSSGGREGMSDGEMVGDTASNLEGSEIDARRTKDQQQKGMIQDGGGPSEAKATGGGKAGALSDRKGMDGTGAARDSNAPRQYTADARAVEQALLAEKTAKAYAQAKLLFLKADRMEEVVRLMDEAQLALRQGRMREFEGLHRKIIGQINAVKGQLHGSAVVNLSVDENGPAMERQWAAGDEGGVPARYKDLVADYYRSLTGEAK